jgi:hypothetical protein
MFIRTVKHFLTKEECDSIIDEFSKSNLETAGIGANFKGEKLRKIRDSQIILTNIDWIKENIRKISGEWHLGPQLKDKFRKFRDEILVQFSNYELYSLDGYNIKWDLFNEHFLDYFTEVIIHIKNY